MSNYDYHIRSITITILIRMGLTACTQELLAPTHIARNNLHLKVLPMSLTIINNY